MRISDWSSDVCSSDLADRDVSAYLRGALIVPKVTHRAASTTPKEAGELLRAIDAYSGYPVTHAALRLAPYVVVRPGELRQAEWSEFDFTRNIWTIAADKTKMRVAHRVPLSRQVLAILEELVLDFTPLKTHDTQGWPT